MTGIGNERSSLITGIVQFRAESQFSNDGVDVAAFSQLQLSGMLPPILLAVSSTQPQPLADVNFHRSKEIDVIFGSGVFEQIVQNDKFQNEPCIHFRKTLFGWVASGPVPTVVTTNRHCYH